jgi:hypothetical protein
MHSKTTQSLVAACVMSLAALGAAPVHAGTQDPGVNKRQHNQRARIVHGVKSDALTRPEAKRLVKTQKRIHRQEMRYKSDGQLTPRERADLHRDLTRSSKRIYRQKHDGQTR